MSTNRMCEDVLHPILTEYGLPPDRPPLPLDHPPTRRSPHPVTGHDPHARRVYLDSAAAPGPMTANVVTALIRSRTLELSEAPYGSIPLDPPFRNTFAKCPCNGPHRLGSIAAFTGALRLIHVDRATNFLGWLPVFTSDGMTLDLRS